MKQKTKSKTRNTARDNIFLIKWLSVIAGALIAGGAVSLGLILLTAHFIQGNEPLSPIWIVGMIPLMAIVAIPVTFVVYKQVRKNVSTLVAGMANVAGGNLDTYIPTAKAGDFATVFENFNKMVAEIQSAEIMRSGMADSLSHELKTPLASIGGFAKLLSEKDLPEDKKKKYLKIIIEESDRIAGMVKNILTLSKLDSQEIAVRKAPYSLNAQITDCIIGLEAEWTRKNIEMSAELAEVEYNVDPDMLKSLWLNLVGNAVKYTPENGSVEIKMTADDKEICVTVTDSGIGMSKAVKDRIFERNFQADKSHSGGGQGLGLPIVKRIVKLCGGSISVTSEEGKGSTFTVILPR